jgi:hypothetical protein
VCYVVTRNKVAVAVAVIVIVVVVVKKEIPEVLHTQRGIVHEICDVSVSAVQ